MTLAQNPPSTLFELEDVLSRKMPYELLSGIYFLVNSSEVVYIGASVNVHGRLAQHRNEGNKPFDSYFFVPCAPEELYWLELHYIRKFCPRLNRAGTPAKIAKKAGVSITEKAQQVAA